jgi:hypothetical protein
MRRMAQLCISGLMRSCHVYSSEAFGGGTDEYEQALFLLHYLLRQVRLGSSAGAQHSAPIPTALSNAVALCSLFSVLGTSTLSLC